MQNIISVRNVSKKYSNHVALSNVSIDVARGAVFGLLGPNGAGKTSLIRIINQITGPDSGEVLFNNEKIGPQHTSRIGYLPEERGLYRKMKVGEQVMYLAQLKGLTRFESKKRLDKWFDKFEMTGWWNKKVEELSKGMQQKVQFIVTVLHEPELLILDEPFSGFDPINAQRIKDEILQLRKNGATVILSTHNMGSVEELCDHIALINRSEKILDGSVRDIRRRFRGHQYKVSFKGTEVAFTHALWTSAEIIEKHTDDGVHTYILRALGETNGSQILQAVVPVCEIISFNEIIPGMNEIFISQVGGSVSAGTKEHTE